MREKAGARSQNNHLLLLPLAVGVTGARRRERRGCAGGGGAVLGADVVGDGVPAHELPSPLGLVVEGVEDKRDGGGEPAR